MEGLDLDGWAREIALAEAAEVRRTVRDALREGRGSAAALQEVARRLDRLTPAQREIVVVAIAEDAAPAGR